MTQSVPPLFHPLSRRGGSLVLAFFACFFVFFKGERRARERTRRSIFFFWISSLFGRTRRRRRERVFLCFCPLFLLVLLLLFLFLSLFLFRENEKRTTLFDALFLISSSVKHTLTHTTRREYSSLFIVFITSSSKRINRNY